MENERAEWIWRMSKRSGCGEYLKRIFVTGFAKTGLIAGVRNYSYSPFSSAK